MSDEAQEPVSPPPEILPHDGSPAGMFAHDMAHLLLRRRDALLAQRKVLAQDVAAQIASIDAMVPILEAEMRRFGWLPAAERARAA